MCPTLSEMGEGAGVLWIIAIWPIRIGVPLEWMSSAPCHLGGGGKGVERIHIPYLIAMMLRVILLR